VGAALEPPHHCILITELMEGGNLKEWLQAGHHSLAQRLTVALEVLPMINFFIT
jgi:hypothetical protein